MNVLTAREIDAIRGGFREEREIALEQYREMRLSELREVLRGIHYDLDCMGREAPGDVDPREFAEGKMYSEFHKEWVETIIDEKLEAQRLGYGR